MPVIAVLLRSTTVRGSARFAAREFFGPAGLCEYRLRDSDLRVFIRHRTPDVVTLDEVFHLRVYEFPERVRASLAAVGRPPTVVDLGANIGLFCALVAARFPGARITAVEPDRDNLRVLDRFIERNGLGDTCEVVAAAAATADGHVPFHAGGFSLSRIAEGGELVRAVDAFAYIAGADLLKIDIEGSEWPILADPRLRNSALRAIVVEYHPEDSPPPDARRAAEQALHTAGFDVVGGEHFAHGSGILWGVRGVAR